MKPYIWYKNNELPLKDCECILIWKEIFFETVEVKRSLGYILRNDIMIKDNNIIGKTCDFITTDGEQIDFDNIIMWMPIKFPEDISLT